MTTKIIASIIIVLVFYTLYKVGTGLLEKDNLLSRIFSIGSIALAIFLISLMFLS